MVGKSEKWSENFPFSFTPFYGEGREGAAAGGIKFRAQYKRRPVNVPSWCPEMNGDPVHNDDALSTTLMSTGAMNLLSFHLSPPPPPVFWFGRSQTKQSGTDRSPKPRPPDFLLISIFKTPKNSCKSPHWRVMFDLITFGPILFKFQFICC